MGNCGIIGSRSLKKAQRQRQGIVFKPIHHFDSSAISTRPTSLPTEWSKTRPLHRPEVLQLYGEYLVRTVTCLLFSKYAASFVHKSKRTANLSTCWWPYAARSMWSPWNWYKHKIYCQVYPVIGYYGLIILVANPIFTYRELGASMENSAFYIKDWKNGTVLTSQYVTWGHF